MVHQQVTSLIIGSRDPSRRKEAHRLGQRLGLTVSDTGPEAESPAGLWLCWTDDGLELRDSESPASRGVRVDFSKRDFRPGSRSMSRRQPLARAMGSRTATVLDATAGLGRDAALLACLGFQVTAVERSPVIAALLEDGLQRAAAEPQLARALGGRLVVILGDAREVLEGARDMPDAIYIDPMFPPKRKSSALAKKDVRLLRAVVGDDPDASDLVRIALGRARQRVIVKRPDHAAPLAANPTATFAGKLVRYDMYATGQQSG